MNRRPGRVDVTTEVAYCSFCGRPRNLRREEHQLGALVRTIVTCETCHRTLSSSVGVAQIEQEPAKEQPKETASAPAAAEEKPRATRVASKKPAVTAPAAARPKKAPPAKRASTTRPTSGKK